MIFKKDNFVFGLVLGIIAPILGIVLFKYTKLAALNFYEAIQFMVLQPGHNLLTLATKDSIRIIQRSINKMKIDVNGCALRGKIEKSGDIYYKGYPTNIDIELLNKGKLISLN